MLSILEAVQTPKVVVTTTTGKTLVGKFVAIGDDVYVVRTGKSGRPPHLNADNIAKIETAA